MLPATSRHQQTKLNSLNSKKELSTSINDAPLLLQPVGFSAWLGLIGEDVSDKDSATESEEYGSLHVLVTTVVSLEFVLVFMLQIKSVSVNCCAL